LEAVTLNKAMDEFGSGRFGAAMPRRLEDYVTDDDPVRVIDVFVGELDLTKLGFEGMTPQATGRPGYHPHLVEPPGT
jgi:transposase